MTLFVILIPIWLFGIIFPPTFESENMASLQFGSFIWLFLAGMVVGRGRFLFGRLFRERISLLIWVVGIVIAMVASAILCEEPTRSLGFVITAALGFVCCVGLWEVVGERMSTCLAIYAYLGTALVIGVYYVGSRVQGRLAIGDAHPNYLGIVSFGVLMSALTVRPRILAGLLIAINLFIIVETQSRSALAASILGLLIFAALKANQMGKRRAAFALAGISLVCTVLLVGYYDVAQDWISSLFFLNDKSRGLGSGFTGRVGAWQEALDLFYGNPVFGVGFRMHENYMTILSSAHNGYLSLLAEIGVVGAVPLFALVIRLWWRLMRQAFNGDGIAILGFSFVAGYLFIAAFERLFLNMGNPTSVLAWMFLLVADPIRSRACAPAWSQAAPRAAAGWKPRVANPTMT